jgi:hypothetical protein
MMHGTSCVVGVGNMRTAILIFSCNGVTYSASFVVTRKRLPTLKPMLHIPHTALRKSVFIQFINVEN